MASLCHLCFIINNQSLLLVSYFETSATALCGTTGTEPTGSTDAARVQLEVQGSALCDQCSASHWPRREAALSAPPEAPPHVPAGTRGKSGCPVGQKCPVLQLMPLPGHAHWRRMDHVLIPRLSLSRHIYIYIYMYEYLYLLIMPLPGHALPGLSELPPTAPWLAVGIRVLELFCRLLAWIAGSSSTHVVRIKPESGCCIPQLKIVSNEFYWGLWYW